MNRRSGKHEGEDRLATIESIFREAGRRYELLLVEDPTELAQTARRAVELAQANGGAVVAAGGDGTLSTVANAVLESGVPFGVLPQGTFNYFGRVNGIPQDAAEATRALLGARIEPIQVGQVNGKVFLVNASLGLYPLLLEDRETFKKRYGRTRGIAIVATLWTVLTQRRNLRLRLDPDDAAARDLRTPMLFVGNNALQLKQIGLPQVQDVQEGKLAAVCVRPIGRLGLIWLGLRGALGRLGEADNVISFAFGRMEVGLKGGGRGGRRLVKVAMDGETSWMRAPLEFRVAGKPLRLLVPQMPLTEEALSVQQHVDGGGK